MSNALPLVKNHAKEVPASRRMLMLPKYFKKHFLMAENTVYHFMQQLSPSYSGGYWMFYEIPRHGFYMSPEDFNKDSTMTICVPYGNDYEGEVSYDAAGIIACLFAYSFLANHTQEEHFIDLYNSLRHFACTHAEATQILQAID